MSVFLAIVCLIQARICFISFATKAHFWLISSLVCTGIPRTFSANLLSSSTDPNVYYCYLELLLPQCRFFHFPFLNLMWFLRIYFSNYWGPSGWQHNSLTLTSATPPSLMPFTTLLRVHSATSFTLLTKMLNRSGASTGFISISVPIYQWHICSSIKKRVLNVLRPENISPSGFLK